MIVLWVFAAALTGVVQAVTPSPSHLPTPVPTNMVECSASTCQVLGWETDPWGSTSVCGESDVNGECSGDVNWDDARDFCQSAGARLCTLSEILDDDVRDTGCNYNTELIWSSTSCYDGVGMLDGYYTAYGSTSSGYDADTTKCMSRNIANSTYTRCCADLEGCSPTPLPTPLPSPRPTPKPTFEPTLLPSPQPSPLPSPKPTPEPTLDRNIDTCSRSSCTELGWTNAESFGETYTCGESQVTTDGECVDMETSWAEARDICQLIGARLCSYSEIVNEEPKNTGCNLNDELVWSATTCGSTGLYAIYGDGDVTDAVCVEGAYDDTTSTTHYVRCCADVFGVSSGCTHNPTTLPTVSPSSFPPTSVPTVIIDSCSTSTCDELGWTNADQFGSNKVCGESESPLTGECSDQLSLVEARRFCQDSGARLCSLDELLDDEARETGCNYDTVQVWSSTSVAAGICSATAEAGDYYFTGYGSNSTGESFYGECADAWDDVAYVRCCADAFKCTSSPTSLPTSNPIPVPTSLPTVRPSHRPTSLPTSQPIPQPSSLPIPIPTSAPIPVPTFQPTSIPTLPPTKMPTPLPTLLPSSLPTMKPSLVPSLAPSITPTNDWRRDDRSDPVACSSSKCEDLGWDYATWGSETVCGETPDVDGVTCGGYVDFDSALDACQDLGARLCSISEIENGDVKDTGCNYNTELIWSGTSCGTDSYYASIGSGDSGTTTCMTDLTTTTSVATRCCADIDGGCSPAPTMLPFPSPSSSPTPLPSPLPTYASVPCTPSTCSELGWDTGNSYGTVDTHFGTTEVCSESSIGDDGCSGAVTYHEARVICEAVGARLCTLSELLADEAHDSGCGYNTELVWSSSTESDVTSLSCDFEEFMIAYGSYSAGLGSEGECLAQDSTAYTRCCADAYGCTDPPTQQPTPLPSPQPTPLPTAQPTVQPSPLPTPYPTSLPSIPSPKPTPLPTPKPTSLPSPLPTPKPTPLPTYQPTPLPTPLPTIQPTPLPTSQPTHIPTSLPTYVPTHIPTAVPFPVPTPKPSEIPTPLPTSRPTEQPTPLPTTRPSPLPTPLPTIRPTPLPTAQPTHAPTPLPTILPTPLPTAQPTPLPTYQPTPVPTPLPTSQPTHAPTPLPTAQPTPLPTAQPTHAPTPQPTFQPTPFPTPEPTPMPTPQPTPPPTQLPTAQPTHVPTPLPTAQPSPLPTAQPTHVPTPLPTPVPFERPSPQPTPLPTAQPTIVPSPLPTYTPTPLPTSQPTIVPTPLPTYVPTPLPSPQPTPLPTAQPTPVPSPLPTAQPTNVPSPLPTYTPTSLPTSQPTHVPTPLPTYTPTPLPTSQPTQVPTPLPTYTPTPLPTHQPTQVPTPLPTAQPTHLPTPLPTSQPTPLPTYVPTSLPTAQPTHVPTPLPTYVPTPLPTPQPTPLPTFKPTPQPSPLPTSQPTSVPSPLPTYTPTPLPTSQPTQVPTPRPTQVPTPLPTSQPTPLPT
eukprot:CAMPEP_0114387328 /NCGR_PEP_ID=MMETSP0102-20121206/7186_1 /TAXON_ID=38822 ORGANISM="Pteridomonas danica, Strain PT" /NCGR_SAMPLE_ID=MMETSP0102 /ASSEMBLY_ACC=CAM_ASM_000212 /LENGTH=1469 /DNA_ID=CAMNT_0001544393 /DNA_START=38 /DNA_END=4443 /DNA_ORIENTATION=+